jgi:hypothetical protein
MPKTSSKFLFIGVVVLALAVIYSSLDVSAAGDFDLLNSHLVFSPVVMKQLPPTPTPGKLHVLDNYSHYVTSWGTLHIVGEVWNNTGKDVDGVQVKAQVYNRDDKLLATQTVPLYLQDLPEDATTCFDVIFFGDEVNGFSSYKFTEPTYSSTGRDLPDLATSSLTGNYDDETGDYEIKGSLKNQDSERLSCVRTVGTLYNKSGKVIGCDYAYTSSVDLNVNQTSSFSILFTGRNFDDVDGFVVQADGSFP